ncbi:biosynthetic peptidoglycan transglycosylase [Breoghania sp.]|uniref:biosynthetic peptidoglycan transglycosylase n=1 Tax=Breoghania sp. TaxID=2065378 RepID=UPI002AA66164|nr:biosynthetic peptidoglycan transglycosylase [Breoghania sp.]
MKKEHTTLNPSERYFPNHKLKRDIGLAEYELAASRLSAEQAALNWAKSAIVAISSIIIFISFKAAEYSDGLKDIGLTETQIKIGSLAIAVTIGILAVVHIANLLKSKHLAERKIIVLRRMMGVRYGENTLVLPNWRLEGADSPFSIHLFPGYFSPRSFPLHLIMVAISTAAMLLGNSVFQYMPSCIRRMFQEEIYFSAALAVILCLVLSGVFKYNLREMHENFILSFSKIVAKVLRVRLVPNFENAIYHIKLDIEEAKRIRADFTWVTRWALEIEDHSFYRHRGISVRGIARAILGKMRKRNLGGGSTITQQFARGNFIESRSNLYRRKIVEILLAFWVESVFEKPDIMKGYLVTARFDSEVYGFHRAAAHFLSVDPREIDEALGFFLIERLGNVRSYFLGRRIAQLLRSAVWMEGKGLSTLSDILKMYQKCLDDGKIFEKDNDISISKVRSQFDCLDITSAESR